MIVGILGAGQLGRMLAMAGYPLGLRFRTLDLSSEAPAGPVSELMVADFNDTDALKRFARGLDLVTYEFENVPVDSARFLNRRVTVLPPPEALEVAQDRVSEKSFFERLGIPAPRFVAVNTWDDLKNALNEIGLPAVLKTRRFGYDGKGQFVLRKTEDVSVAWQSLSGVPLILESFVAFEREVSILAVRSRPGETRFYPLVENHHQDGILRLSLCPAPGASFELQSEAEDYAKRTLEALNYVGVLAIEFFQHEGHLLANEMAPRVHNSGHWTIEGAETSQFENHLRAILGLPLGSTATVGYSAMLNIIGTIPDSRTVLSIPDVHLHLYGKAARPNRKLGHITIRAQSEEARGARLAELRSITEQ
ncbi:MAG TPA: 5-(carboxyamino)imidazole ribonucleotide synthase [Blastocatellia bacterium]|nr:5-(carboxyamino)imidazole ribonucleotide synthase [Blastocatellia bacterium]